jgi:hypothetical protein
VSDIRRRDVDIAILQCRAQELMVLPCEPCRDAEMAAIARARGAPPTARRPLALGALIAARLVPRLSAELNDG